MEHTASRLRSYLSSCELLRMNLVDVNVSHAHADEHRWSFEERYQVDGISHQLIREFLGRSGQQRIISGDVDIHLVGQSLEQQAQQSHSVTN